MNELNNTQSNILVYSGESNSKYQNGGRKNKTQIKTKKNNLVKRNIGSFPNSNFNSNHLRIKKTHKTQSGGEETGGEEIGYRRRETASFLTNKLKGQEFAGLTGEETLKETFRKLMNILVKYDTIDYNKLENYPEHEKLSEFTKRYENTDYFDNPSLNFTEIDVKAESGFDYMLIEHLKKQGEIKIGMPQYGVLQNIIIDKEKYNDIKIYCYFGVDTKSNLRLSSLKSLR